MTKYRVAENIGISYEMKNENKYQSLVDGLTAGGRKGPNTMDLDLSHRFTFGAATSYTDRDGRTIDVTCGDSLQLNKRIAEVKSSLINGETLIAQAKTTLRKAICHLQRLSERTLLFNSEATVWSA